ncbi:hypothetical protein [Sulfitobacter sp. 20_GPM-1509m]|uniref:hypothetical protein n=1 Tax=Sulfitobacter sp. 20_GPM-1509m TaxID=1380367 RepID=UPI0012DCF42E|nr:hypothetical protein [Sulfitobacter sp. 20_GPM-1509m]
MDWLEYSNQGATRNQPLDGRLVGAMSFLPEMGVTMRVISGGQDAKGEGDRRTGSTRHDHGGAADADFYKDGRKLDWNNPEDRPLFEAIVSRARANGVTGIGAGDDYMGAGRMHIGFGSEAVWGAGGKGDNAPDWLRSAYYGTPAGQPPAGGQQGDPWAYTPGNYAQGPQGPQQNQLAAQEEQKRPEFQMRNILQDPRAFMQQPQNQLAQGGGFDVGSNPFLNYLRTS